MRKLSDISEILVPVDEHWWGRLYWLKGGPLGFNVRHFKDPALLHAYASLQDEAYGWGHADPLAWHVLIIDAPYEVGEDFVMIKRYPGVSIEQFSPDRTDDPVDPPIRQLTMLTETVARMRTNAESPADKVIAELVAKRVGALDYRIVYDSNEGEERFHLYDLDPDQDELAAWIATAPNPS